ncbi:MAG: hydantoinase B/oxoprolinase family protein, partial [Solimonas sp.]
MLKRYPAETLKPGDIVVTNDPWMGTGHLFDITLMRPVFRNGRIVAYTISITHLPDIGGNGFGSSATEVYQEGLRLPICKLYEEGRPNELLIDIIRTNVRVPEQTMGDIMANVSCNEVGGREINAFMDEYGLDDLIPLSRAIRGQSEAAMRAKIAELKDGTYRNRIKLEGFEGPVEFAVRVDIAGNGASFDFDGTSGCVRAGVNVPFCYTNAMALHALKSLTLPSIPNNAGSIAPIKVSAPPGCILHALPPYPTGGRHAMGHFVTPLIYGALAEAIPSQVQADSGMMNLITFQGLRRDDRPCSTLYFAAGGYGALDGMDGSPATPGPSNMIGTPDEIWENDTGTTNLRKAILPDTGGPGA